MLTWATLKDAGKQFAEDQLPGIYNALRIELAREVLAEQTQETLWCEVAQHLGGGRVRAIALGSTDGVQRGAQALAASQEITVPVGLETLGRVFNLLGEPIEDLVPRLVAEAERQAEVGRPGSRVWSSLR